MGSHVESRSRQMDHHGRVNEMANNRRIKIDDYECRAHSLVRSPSDEQRTRIALVNSCIDRSRGQWQPKECNKLLCWGKYARTQRERNTIIIIINFIVDRAVRRSNIPRLAPCAPTLSSIQSSCTTTAFTVWLYVLHLIFCWMVRAMSSTATPSTSRHLYTLLHSCASACACLRCLWNCSNGIYFAYFYCLCAHGDALRGDVVERMGKKSWSTRKHENVDDAAPNHRFWMLLQASESVRECNSRRPMVVVANRRWKLLLHIFVCCCIAIRSIRSLNRYEIPLGEFCVRCKHRDSLVPAPIKLNDRRYANLQLLLPFRLARPERIDHETRKSFEHSRNTVRTFRLPLFE